MESCIPLSWDFRVLWIRLDGRFRYPERIGFEGLFFGLGELPGFSVFGTPYPSGKDKIDWNTLYRRHVLDFSCQLS